MTESAEKEKDEHPSSGNGGPDGDVMRGTIAGESTSRSEEVDEFGLPVRRRTQPLAGADESDNEDDEGGFHDAQEERIASNRDSEVPGEANEPKEPEKPKEGQPQESALVGNEKPDHPYKEAVKDAELPASTQLDVKDALGIVHGMSKMAPDPEPAAKSEPSSSERLDPETSQTEPKRDSTPREGKKSNASDGGQEMVEKGELHKDLSPEEPATNKRRDPRGSHGVSEWSHQKMALHDDDVSDDGNTADLDWQDMPAFAEYDLYDDDGRLVARGKADSDEDDEGPKLGGAAKGYTRVQIDDDAKSATSMDENTNYLFKDKGTNVVDEDEEQRDPLAQMQATKDLLTEGQRIAYVGVTRLAMYQMENELGDIQGTKATVKTIRMAHEAIKMWGQKMMVRLYSHMDIDSAEQVMIEQLAEHGVHAADLVPPLMQNARVANPMAESPSSSRPSISKQSPERKSSVPPSPNPSATPPPPAYKEHMDDELPDVRTPSQMPTSAKIDLDLRWTVLCDLFLVLIADSMYDARSRLLLERVGQAMDISWVDICRFEKRVIDALEMQEAAVKENWDEADHMENRRKLALKKKYMMMGLATVGGSLVIGLSAGLLAPVIGAGLAAGFTTIGVAGTGGFLGGVGGTALITSGAVASGGIIAGRASHRRTGAVKTFEYRPLHNNKRVNLIVTVAGWMNGKVDDVRLPFSTVDPIMGDLYSVLWEPEMLQSMGQTINILATEVGCPSTHCRLAVA